MGGEHLQYQFIPMLKHFLVSFSPCLIPINLRKWQQFFLKVDKVDQAWVNVADTILSTQSQGSYPIQKRIVPNLVQFSPSFPYPSRSSLQHLVFGDASTLCRGSARRGHGRRHAVGEFAAADGTRLWLMSLQQSPASPNGCRLTAN